MGSINVRPETGKLFFDFRYRGKRCREQTTLEDTPANRKKMRQVLDKIEAEITLGQFEYGKYFPGSPRARQFKEDARRSDISQDDVPLFSEFGDTWMEEMKIQWRESHYDTVMLTFEKYLKPAFGEHMVNCITKADILQFRTGLAKVPGRGGRESLSAERINHIMTPLRMILNEAADRFDFNSPYRGIKSLKVPRTEVEPFSLSEVMTILEKVRPDFQPYYTVRFFTGMRTAEIDGLKWQYVDFENRLILVREAYVNGRVEPPKNEGSIRDISMSQPVYDALMLQKKWTEERDYVFVTANGSNLIHNNVTKRVWYPLLRHLGLKKRRPYQTRHTAATLWLAAGENPEWIARQLGHATTEMLFRIYSRYVPNLTRQDGSAFDRLLTRELGNQDKEDSNDE